ncbi:unnamed protein product [Nippostrongylus brasiliensis]|uniref:G_PROTEIN_RECEP_F1_2 domain-containing protein n=1 Tax=Nippostrongylus brasiliensis TaxID=27835 RepID=A0A0N4XTM9_NIPBR|nr:unnamed protein product [Nippostrongylus brasiliensis]
MASIIVTKHLHSRPQRLLAISCAFFLIASVYDLAFDISYLVIINKTAFVDALERFLIVFFNYDMSLAVVFLLYTAFPLVSIGLAFYNSFVSYTFITSDDVCAMVRRTKWTNIALVTIQWGSAAIAVLMYVAVWKQVRRKHKTKIPEPTCKGAPHHQKMGTERYYWDPKVVLIFFICCVVSLILILYITFPAVNIAFSAYNSFLTSDWVKDDVVCLITRRSSLTSNLLFASQWVATLIAILLYFRIYRKIIRHVERQRNSSPGSLSQQNYYRDRSVVSLFFVCTTIPIILVCPTIVVTLVSAIFGVHNKVRGGNATLLALPRLDDSVYLDCLHTLYT